MAELRYSIIALLRKLINMGNLCDSHVTVEKRVVVKGFFPAMVYGMYKEEGIRFQSSHGEKAQVCSDMGTKAHPMNVYLQVTPFDLL